MATLDELASIMFGGTDGEEVSEAVTNTAPVMFYATALSTSVNGEVSIQIGDAVYALEDQEDTDSYEEVYLSDPDDDAESIGADDDTDEEEYEYVWDESDEEDAVEEDE